jgi:hypothetical protein
MRSLERLARSRTAAAAGAAVLALLLGMSALGSFPRQPGIDFYQFWGVPLARASANLQATPYTDGPAYARVLNAMADASASPKLREANRYRRTLELMGTPFLYAAFAVFPEDYRRAQTIFALIQYCAAWVAVYILARLAPAAPWPAACVAFLVLLTFNPFVQDVRVGNVNSLQLLVLTVLLAISSRKAFSGRDWLDGFSWACSRYWSPSSRTRRGSPPRSPSTTSSCAAPAPSRSARPRPCCWGSPPSLSAPCIWAGPTRGSNGSTSRAAWTEAAWRFRTSAATSRSPCSWGAPCLRWARRVPASLSPPPWRSRSSR